MTNQHPSAMAAVEPAFILLFSIRLKGTFDGFAAAYPGVQPLPENVSHAYLDGLAESERTLLGKTFLAARRMRRWPLGRIPLGDSADASAPDHADVYLLGHKSGVALWEVWMSAPAQAFDASRWIDWLDADAEDGLVARVWRVLGGINRAITGKDRWSGLYLPLVLPRLVRQTLDAFVDAHASDLARLLFLDCSHRPLKPAVVAEELARDYCARQGGMTLLSRRSGLDLRDADAANDRGDTLAHPGLPPKSVRPFLLTLELLLLEQAVLQHLYERLSRHMPSSVDELLALKQEVLDALEEYYGAITHATRFSEAVTTDGERLLGLGDLYDAVMERLETVSFAITTRYQKRMALLQVWLTVVFGATEVGFIAASIAIWYYKADLFAILAWTVGASIVSGLVLVSLLRGKVR